MKMMPVLSTPRNYFMIMILLLVSMVSLVAAHQQSFSLDSVQALSGPKSTWSGGHSYLRWVPHKITLPKPSFSVRRVPLPFPYPVFRHHQVPFYSQKDTHGMATQETTQVPVKIPKYIPVPVHKVIEVPQYIEVPVEVPVYQEVIVRRPVEVPVPVYITRKAVASTQSAPLIAAALPAAFNSVDTGLTPVKKTLSHKGSASALIPVSQTW